MTFCLRIALLVSLIIGTHTQDFDLLDALGDPDPDPTPAKPKDTDGFDLFDAFGPDTVTKKPVAPPPKDGGAGGDDFNILDAFDNEPKKPDPKKPSGGGIDGFDLEDALGPDPKPDKPAVVPPKSGGTGGGSFDDGDLFDIGNDNEYKPDGGKPGGRASDPGSNQGGGADQPQEAAPGQIAGIASAIGMALLGAASSYFAYQKKKLCFKVQGGEDPERGKTHQGAQSEPQVLSNLLRASS
ncbi:CD99 molecule isoform X1 [Osmerus eperlanus]|uniref:CD99 molecule isoform X1 n=1 Tax=Osmerus eperlanus TaxID=29151 RepID=UPI002E10CB48